MAKYNLIVRRRPIDSWSPWCCTDSEETLKHNIEVIESYGYSWSLETPMAGNAFRKTCLAQGIDIKKIIKYMIGRNSFTTDDIEALKEVSS